VNDRNKRERERIAAKRATDPVYRELERYAVRKRMRKLRSTPGYVRPDRVSATAPAAIPGPAIEHQPAQGD
jgi:hypothetical protein